jgi:hypothetical protein
MLSQVCREEECELDIASVLARILTALGTSLSNTRKNLARACFFCTQEGEERQKELLEAQIQRAKAATADKGPAEGTELQRDEDGKPLQIVLGGASRAAAKEASAAAFPSVKGFRVDDEVSIAQNSCTKCLETPCKSQWVCSHSPEQACLCHVFWS